MPVDTVESRPEESFLDFGVPVADWFDPQEMWHDPYPAYERMREMGPVVYAPAVKRVFMTRHESVTYAEQHPELFRSYSDRNVTMVRAMGGRPMLRKDDPEHATERAAINPTLRPRAVTQVWSPQFATNVETWLNYLLEIGPEHADLNRDFASPIASKNLVDLIGLPSDTDLQSLHRWSRDFILGTGNLLDDPEIWRRCDQSQAELNAVLDELLPYLRKHPNPSMASHMLEAGLPENVVRANIMLTISGGMNEPQHMITNMVRALSEHPDQRAEVLRGDVAWGDAFEETVRWLSPVGMVPREVASDVECFGAKLPEFTNVGLLLGSANRDDAAFENPNAFDVHRTARGHLAFGAGTHMCAGRWTAKAAVSENALPMLYARIPGLTLDPSRKATTEGWVFRGISELPVTW